MSLRDRYNAFIDRHEIAWELTFAALAIVYVIVGFASPETRVELAEVFLANVLLTIVFAADVAAVGSVIARHIGAAVERRPGGATVDLGRAKTHS